MIEFAKIIVNVGHLAARLGTITALLLTVVSFLDFWVCGEQLASLRPYYATATIAAVAWFAIFRRPNWGVLSAAVVVIGFWGMQPSSSGGSQESLNTHSPLRVLTTNAYIGNPDQTRLARLAKDTRADLVLVTELNVDLAAQLRESYPHFYTTDLNGVLGMGIFSRYPLTHTEISYEKTYDSPCIHAVVQTPDGPVNLMLVHPFPPSTQEGLNARNKLINYATSLMGGSDLPMILAGDFNTTTWSRHLSPLLKVAERAPSGGTWPAHLPIRIPIDHLFYKGSTLKGVFEFNEDYGTDHVPFLTVLVPR